MMNHYDNFRKPYGYCLVPIGNTSDLLKDKKHSTSTIDDALGFCDREHNEEEAVAINEKVVPIRKHLKGKAEGARFCYLSSIAAASPYANGAADLLGQRLDDLVNGDHGINQHFTLMMIVEYASLAIGSIKKLFNGVIAVRNKALESGKYTQESWKQPIDVDLLLDAAARHLISYLYVGEIDDESGENHMCHIVANVLMIAQQLRGNEYGN